MGDKLCNHTTTDGGKRMICTREAGHAGWHMGETVAEMQPACVGEVPDLPEGVISLTLPPAKLGYVDSLTIQGAWYDNDKPNPLIAFTFNGERYVRQEPPPYRGEAAQSGPLVVDVAPMVSVTETELRQWLKQVRAAMDAIYIIDKNDEAAQEYIMLTEVSQNIADKLRAL